MRYTYDVPFTTYEGDNSVLTQQTARFLLKEIQKLQSDEKLERCTSFFKNYFDNNENILINTVNDCYDMNLLEKLLENFAFLNTKKTAEDFANLIMEVF